MPDGKMGSGVLITFTPCGCVLVLVQVPPWQRCTVHVLVLELILVTSMRSVSTKIGKGSAGTGLVLLKADGSTLMVLPLSAIRLA